MKVFKKLICILLVLCFVGTALVGCGKKDKGSSNADASGNSQNGQQATETQKETNEYGEPSFTTNIPVNDLDFEGEKLTVMLRENETTERQWYKESPEDELDEAVAMRNSAVAETLNLDIDFEIMPYGEYNSGTTNYNNTILQDVLQNFHYYDIADHWALAGGYSSIRDCNANVLDEAVFPYFNFELPCWNQSVCTDAVVNNRLHLITGDINITQFDMAVVFWYNKTLYDQKRESTDHDNIQDLALEGAWTYAELYRWANRLYEDSNGEEGRQTSDTYGFATQNANINNQPVPKDAIAAAFDIDLLITNPDGTHSYNIEGNERAAKARDMWIDIFKQTGTTDSGSVENFASGKYVFWVSMMYPGKQGNMTIREMDDKYGLLPMPKFDLEQEQYYTAAYDGYSLMSVLDHEDVKGEAVSAYLQFATEESYTSVRGYYFNRIVKPKYFGTDDSEGTVTKSIALFDIIVANIRFDFWTIYSAQLNHLTWKWRTSLLEDWDSLEAAYTKEKAVFDKALLEMDAWFGLITLPDEE
ncbi:MAG: hypothetical protein E7642_01550 [Ruminococcaceae bacterium]|nr:hypothetical protein [Oscillospiraceae bacterium]